MKQVLKVILVVTAVALVTSVVVYLLWKRHGDSGKGGDKPPPGGGGNKPPPGGGGNKPPPGGGNKPPPGGGGNKPSCSDETHMNKLINSVGGQVLPSSQIGDPGQCGYYDQPIDNSGCNFTCPPGKIWNEWDPNQILPTCTQPSGRLKCDENTGIELDIPRQLIVNKGKEQPGSPGCVPKDSVGHCSFKKSNRSHD